MRDRPPPHELPPAPKPVFHIDPGLFYNPPVALTPTGGTPSPTNLSTGIRLEALDDARFAPGRLFGSRYRIVTLLGRGAMGEVYRADDLRLGQPVALKLMSEAMARRADGLVRLTSEVRLARGVAHPNVCRVYDIGHAEGWHYLSMEFVDGETLDSLLRRIGQPPLTKALEMARQLCAGLAAAHECGVLHPDLKPANIMVDGRGHIRILDFGLAVTTADAVGEVAGTPAYMAPEQRAGEPATIQSDLYSLGRVLSELVPPDTDGPAAAVIQRCLQHAPDRRPRSARLVLAALPPGALRTSDDGVIPTPAMVAAAPTDGALAPTTAWLLLSVALGGCTLLASQAFVFHLRPSEVPKPPEVLAERAREILVERGQDGPVVDRAFWWWADPSSRQIFFTYRQSATPLVPGNLLRVVTESDPPPDGASGIVTVDSAGQVVTPRAATSRSMLSTGRSPAGETALWLFVLFGFVAGSILARRNLRAGEGDSAGAWKLATFVAAGGVLSAALRAHHVPSLVAELVWLLTVTGWSGMWAAFSWLAYVSFEPYVRRWWPLTLVAWTRLLAGGFRDPLIGREVLLGMVSAMVSTSIILLSIKAPELTPPSVFRQPALDALQSSSLFSSHLVGSAVLTGLQYSLSTVASLVVFRLVFRRTWIAASILAVVALPLFIETVSAAEVVSALAVVAVGFTTLIRVGVLAHVVMLIVAQSLTTLPLTLDGDAWYFGRSLVVLVLLGTLATYGFLVSLGSRPAFGDLTKVPASRS